MLPRGSVKFEVRGGWGEKKEGKEGERAGERREKRGERGRRRIVLAITLQVY